MASDDNTNMPPLNDLSRRDILKSATTVAWLMATALVFAASLAFDTVAQTTHPGRESSEVVMPSKGVTDPLAGNALYADVQRYESFGVHRYGSVGLQKALDWLADRLRTTGLAVEEQRFSIGRQDFLDSASLAVGGTSISVIP